MAAGNERRSDRELLDAAQRGDDLAFWVFFRRHSNAVYDLAFDGLDDELDAQDVTQQVFETAWRKSRQVRMVADSAEAWLLLTCRNVVANRKRSRQRRRVMERLDDAVMWLLQERAMKKASDLQLLARIEEEVAGMPELDQRVYREVLVAGLSYVEAAEALGISIASVGKRVNRVRARVREQFGDER